jgi:hypothetical protein
MLAVNGLVHGSHVFRCDFPCKGGKGTLNPGPALQRIVAHQRNSLVGRKIVLVVLEHGQTQCLDWPIRRVGGDHVDLVIVSAR